MAKYHLVNTYIEAVERDKARAHPIQRAEGMIPSTEFATAAELYRYCVCAYDSQGVPLEMSAPANSAHWVVFDNVYCRGGKDKHPANAVYISRDFNPGPGPRDQAKARRLWEASVSRLGEP